MARFLQKMFLLPAKWKAIKVLQNFNFIPPSPHQLRLMRAQYESQRIKALQEGNSEGGYVNSGKIELIDMLLSYGEDKGT